MRQRRSAAGGAAPAKGPEALPNATDISVAFDARLERDVAEAAVRHGLGEVAGAVPAGASRGFAVSFLRREGARKMLDIVPAAFSWYAGKLTAGFDVDGAKIKGALVRIRPASDASAELVERVRQAFLAAGAAAVKVLPPAAGAALAPQEVEAAPSWGIREVVEACAARTRSKDRAALDAVIDWALSEEGL